MGFKRRSPVDKTLAEVLESLESNDAQVRMEACQTCSRLARQEHDLRAAAPTLSILLSDNARAPLASPIAWYAADALGRMATVAVSRQLALHTLRAVAGGKSLAQRVSGYGLVLFAVATGDIEEVNKVIRHERARVREGGFSGLNKVMTRNRLELAVQLAEPVDRLRWQEPCRRARAKADALMQTLRFIVRTDHSGAEVLYQCALRSIERAEELAIEDDPQAVAATVAILDDALQADGSHRAALALRQRLVGASTAKPA